VIFENFVYDSLMHIRSDAAYEDATVVLFMDNAVIHKHSAVLETARKFKVNVLFNAEYSPWLNPIERFFGAVKHKTRSMSIRRK
jgi:transposase